MFKRFTLTLLSRSLLKGESVQSKNVLRCLQIQCRNLEPKFNYGLLSSLPEYRGDPIPCLKIQIPKREPVVKRILDVPVELPVIGDTIIPVNNAVEDPGQIVEKQAARMIVIRRRKMKRHRLKKLRKRMKYVWAKVRQKREMRKEKAFQAELMSQIKEARKFTAEAYASDKLNKANQVLIPTRWRGKLYPDFIIDQLMNRKESKAKIKIERDLRRKQVDRNPLNYKY